MKTIKLEVDSNKRNHAINWWNSISDIEKKELITEHEVKVLTGRIIQEIFDICLEKVQPVIQDKVYNKFTVVELIDKFKTEYCKELTDEEFNQFLIDNL